MRDNRDPSELGHKLLEARAGVSACFGLSRIADHTPLHVREYPDETTLEKYGRPQLIVSTLPN